MLTKIANLKIFNVKLFEEIDLLNKEKFDQRLQTMKESQR